MNTVSPARGAGRPLGESFLPAGGHDLVGQLEARQLALILRIQLGIGAECTLHVGGKILSLPGHE